MKPILKICRKCENWSINHGEICYMLVIDYAKNGITIGKRQRNNNLVTLTKIEVPKECPYILEHTVNQPDKS